MRELRRSAAKSSASPQEREVIRLLEEQAELLDRIARAVEHIAGMRR
jgi:hypothetical protein